MISKKSISLISIIAIICVASAIAKVTYFDTGRKSANEETAKNIISHYQQKKLKVAMLPKFVESKYFIESFEKEYNFNFEYVVYDDFLSASAAIESGEADLFPGIAYTPERAKIYNYSDGLYASDVNLFSKDPDIFDDLSKLNYGTIVTLAGSIYPTYSNTIAPRASQLTVKSREDYEIAYQNDYNIIDSASMAGTLINKGYQLTTLNNTLDVVAVCVIAPKDKHEELLGIVSDFAQGRTFQNNFLHFKENYYKRLKIGYNLDKVNLELFPKSHAVYIGNYPPFSYLNDTKRGALMSILDEMYDTLHDALASSNNHLAKAENPFTSSSFEDASIYVGVLKEETLGKDLIYSEPIYVLNTVVAKRSDMVDEGFHAITDLLYSKIGVVKDSFYDNYLKSTLSLPKIHQYLNKDQLIKSLKAGDVDYILIEEPAFNNYVVEHQDPSVEIYYDIYLDLPIELRFAFPHTSDGYRLLSLFNTVLPFIDKNKLYTENVKRFDYVSFYKKNNFLLLVAATAIALSLVVSLRLLFRYRRSSLTDHLCKVKNRKFLMQKYKRGLPINRCLIYLDINNFKDINDVFGHDFGDRVLINFSTQIRTLTKVMSIEIFRIGGDEFVLIAPNDRENIERIIKDISSFTIQDAKHTFSLSVHSSLGILPGDIHNFDVQKALSIVDMAMYKAKNSDNKTITITKESLVEFSQKLEVSRRLYQAVERKELTAYFQPIIDIRTNKIVSVEARSRWKTNGEVLSADQYIENAKLIGMECELNKASYLEAIKCNSAFKALGIKDIEITFNATDGFLQMFTTDNDFFSEAFADPESFCFEIQEHTVLNQKIYGQINNLIEHGFSLAIDNFGTDQMSLNTIYDNRLKYVKIDKSLLPQNNDQETIDKCILTSQVEMMKNFSKVFIVEGVEEQWQLDYIKSIGVNNVQGFYYSKAIPLPELLQYIEKMNN